MYILKPKKKTIREERLAWLRARGVTVEMPGEPETGRCLFFETEVEDAPDPRSERWETWGFDPCGFSSSMGGDARRAETEMLFVLKLP